MWKPAALLHCVFSAMVAMVVADAGQDFASQSYDYLIVGGGTAGLVVASRLSALANISIGVIEAGDSGYNDEARFTIPAANLYQSSLGTRYDWQWTTAPQTQLGGRNILWPRGKVLGGSSAVNGLYYIRHSQVEQDAWAALLDANDEYAQRWEWSSMLDAMKRSETFTGASSELTASLVNTAVKPLDNAEAHGTAGPLHVSYVPNTYPLITAFFKTVAALDVPMSSNPDAGESWGAFIASSNINPVNATRSFSRNAYLDPIAYRPNLHLLTGHTVTKILFSATNTHDGKATATGIQYSASGNTSSEVYVVNATREVILCAGAVNDPQLLQLSGVGDAALLTSLGMAVRVDLPGVGYHLQDHVVAALHFMPVSTTSMPSDHITGNSTLDCFVNSAVAYVPGHVLFGAEWPSLLATIRTNISAAAKDYTNTPAAVQKGYEATYRTQVDTILGAGSNVAPVEYLFALSYGQVHIIAALQQPLSRGSILINSSDPFAPPRIDPRYLAQSVDRTVLRTAIQFAHKIATTPPLSTLLSSQIGPLPPFVAVGVGGGSATKDAQWDDWLEESVSTEYHPSSTCAMLPRRLGGVVDAALRVYGTSNVRVIDASVPPFPLAAHLVSVTYAVGEIGADIVLADYQRDTNPAPPNTSISLHHPCTLSLVIALLALVTTLL